MRIKEALKIIDELIEDYENVHKVYVISSHSGGSNGARATNKATVTKKTIDDLEKIKKILKK